MALMYQGIEFRSVVGALWSLWTVNNNFIIPTQEIQFSWGNYWGAATAISVGSAMIYLWYYQHGNLH